MARDLDYLFYYAILYRVTGQSLGVPAVFVGWLITGLASASAAFLGLFKRRVEPILTIFLHKAHLYIFGMSIKSGTCVLYLLKEAVGRPKFA